MEDLIFKALFHPSKRHMPIIFGNILTEAEERQKLEKNLFNPFFLTALLMKGANHITCPFENYSLAVHATIKVTHAEACFCDSPSESVVNTHPPLRIDSPNASYSLLQLPS